MLYAADSDEIREKYEQAIYGVIDQIDPKWSDLKKLFFLHDWLVLNCEYDVESFINKDTEKASTSYSVFFRHLAVCSGYASCFHDLCNRAGIEAHYVSSEENDHAWNIVGLNGTFYYVDCTWDDPGGIECEYDNFPGKTL